MRWLGYSSWHDGGTMYSIYVIPCRIFNITVMHQNTPRCRVPDIFKRRSQFGLKLSSADREILYTFAAYRSKPIQICCVPLKSCTNLLRTTKILYRFAAYHSNPIHICCVPFKSYTNLLRTTEILYKLAAYH